MELVKIGLLQQVKYRAIQKMILAFELSKNKNFSMQVRCNNLIMCMIINSHVKLTQLHYYQTNAKETVLVTRPDIDDDLKQYPIPNITGQAIM